jgi:hypothetical protein
MEGWNELISHPLIRGGFYAWALIGLVELIFLGGFIAILVTLFSRADQRAGDMAAGTLVVRERSVNRIVAPAQFSPLRATRPTPPPWTSRP